VEHTESILESFLFERAAPSAGAEAALARMTDASGRSLYARFARNGTWVDPTLVEFRAASAYEGDSAAEHDPRRRYAPPELRAFWDRYFPLPDSVPAAKATLRRRALVVYQRAVGLMHAAGVGLLAGTDLGARNVYPGFSLHDELALLVGSGLSPAAALRAATVNAARAAGLADSVGAVAPGRVADLVLLDADPLDDIRNTARIRAVVANGRLFRRAALDSLLAAALQVGNVR
jgi:hypothetical protein